jgi:PAS domain S-box-containing protein
MACSRSEEFYRALIEHSLDLVAILEKDGRVSFVGPSVKSILGYTSEELLGRSILEFVHPSEEHAAMAALQTAVKRPGVTRYAEARIRHRDGSWRWHEVSAYNLIDDPGIGGLVINSRDITERKRAEKMTRAQRDLALSLSGAGSLAQVAEISLRAIIEASEMDCGAIHLLNKESGSLDIIHHQGISAAFAAEVAHYEGDSAILELVKAGKPIYTTHEELDVPRTEARRAEGIKAVAIVPMMQDDEVIGSVSVASHVLEEIPPHARDVIEILVSQIGMAVARSRLASALSESEERYRLLHDYAGLAIFAFDREMKVISINNIACEQIGYREEELLGRNIFELGIIHPEDLERAQEGIRTILSGARTHVIEIRLIRKDGFALLCEFTAAPLHDEKGEIAAFINIIQDVTARKEAEETLRRSEERYRATFESTGTAMFLVDRNAFVTDANRKMEESFGYTREEVVGKMRYMQFLMPEEVERVKEISLKLLRGELEGPVQYEVRARHKTGRLIEALISVSMLPGMESSVVSVMDVTEKKKYERELVERAEQLKDFLDIAAHELRHPTTLLKGYAMTLKNRWDTLDAETLEESLEAMQVGADRLVHVVQELLDMSRVERDRFPMLQQEVAIEPLVKRAVSEMQAKGGEVDIRVDLKRGVGSAYADEEGLLRILIILLDNAVNYSPPGSTVEIVVEREGEEAVFSVLDRGMGIPEEDRERIFERFFQVDDVLHHSGPGLGVGLYIAKRIVEAHGGRIWYEPREGGGSAFRFTIPLRGSGTP